MDAREGKSLRARPAKAKDVPVLDDDTPPFIASLLHVVEDPATQHLCHWTASGNTFVIEDPEQ